MKMLEYYFIHLLSKCNWTNPWLAFVQISTRAGWLRSWMPTCWWRPGRDKNMSYRPTAPCPNMPWTSRGFSFLDQSCSSLTTITQSGVCRELMRTRWPAWGTWTGRRPKCGVAGGWSALSTLWFSRPSDRWWTGTLAVEQKRRTAWLGMDQSYTQ